jgi:hypothetical protein
MGDKKKWETILVSIRTKSYSSPLEQRDLSIQVGIQRSTSDQCVSLAATHLRHCSGPGELLTKNAKIIVFDGQSHDNKIQSLGGFAKDAMTFAAIFEDFMKTNANI